jgi:hypothetical protein
MLRSEDIQIRDPFVVPLETDRRYVMYGTTDPDCWEGRAAGFNAYTSVDLRHWDGPYTVFRASPGFWADRNFWAPEVHRHRDGWFMFATFKAESVCRGTQVLFAERPLGVFAPHSEGPVTPGDWECLDGTLWVEDGRPWIVFCHEWMQIGDGTICATPLSDDLRAPREEPRLLFAASEPSWVCPYDKTHYVTDGPFLHRCADGTLLMLWSSFTDGGYSQGVARSPNGTIVGPWVHDHSPLFTDDGGHGMVFRTFDGELLLTLHTPNKTPHERPRFFRVSEQEGRLRCEGEFPG